MLRDHERSLNRFARQFGYATPFALSTAFKRVTGVSPAGHRAAVS